ncbi:hypothetical protein [Streptomyces sp. YIM 98790]|uniref:hypothetical protein n=1 Tax=Streptomyces sp. YIM 98790 TaxID=2689077 RepID=UPI001407D7CC|nr:hypothetical protein [Streptomyces sp. YIM 98790]
MSIDPTEPEIVDELLEEEREAGLETPEADAAEQRAELRAGEDEPLPPGSGEANPADLAEQARVVAEDEDEDYR